jgi:cytochrome bd-type quinol oxidase subunit 1
VYSQRGFEKTAVSVATLGRGELKRQIKNFRGRFKLDFTEAYLNTVSLDRLRHILLAALITGKSYL